MNKKIIHDDFIGITPIEECREYDRQSIHQHDYFEIIWFTEVQGEDTILIDFGEFPISANCFYLVAAGHLHRIDRTNKKGCVISLSKSFYYAVTPVEIQARSTYVINSIINQQKCNMCRTLIQMIIDEYDMSRRYALLEAYFKALFIHFSPIFEKCHCAKNEKNRVSDLLNMIEENYTVHKECGFYAQQLSLSEKAANEFSKKTTGKTIKSLIQERLILEIKREVATNNLSFKEIANKLGFSEPTYFSRFFKKQTGYTPEEYKIHFNEFLEE